MESNDVFVQEQYQIAYNFALYKLGNSALAEEAAAQTINLFLLKSEMINSEKYSSWVRGTCLNYCRKYYDHKKKEQYLNNGIKETLINHFKTEHDTGLSENFQLAMEKLDELETRTLVLYFKCDQSTKSMSEITGENQSSLRKRIYRIKQKLKAETYKSLGYIATKKIIVPKLHEAIIQFVRRLKRNIENNTINKMFYYFSETSIKNYRPDFDIQKIKDYEVTLKNNVYKIYIFYHDSESQINTISFKFYLNEKNQLKITDLPEKKRKLVRVKKNTESAKELEELLKKFPEGRKGLVKIPPEVMEKLTHTA